MTDQLYQLGMSSAQGFVAAISIAAGVILGIKVISWGESLYIYMFGAPKKIESRINRPEDDIIPLLRAFLIANTPLSSSTTTTTSKE
jgi:hypothetical protein